MHCEGIHTTSLAGENGGAADSSVGNLSRVCTYKHISVHNFYTAAWPSQKATSQWVVLPSNAPYGRKSTESSEVGQLI